MIWKAGAGAACPWAGFWAEVAGLCPDYAEARAWLRRNGPALLRYDFSAGAGA